MGRTSVPCGAPKVKAMAVPLPSGWARRTAAAAWRMASHSMSAVDTGRAGAGSPSPGASRRITAWKWTTPRAWYSATLTYRIRTRARSRFWVMPRRRARCRGR